MTIFHQKHAFKNKKSKTNKQKQTNRNKNLNQNKLFRQTTRIYGKKSFNNILSYLRGAIAFHIGVIQSIIRTIKKSVIRAARMHKPRPSLKKNE